MHAAVLENFGGSLAEQEITVSDSNAGRKRGVRP